MLRFVRVVLFLVFAAIGPANAAESLSLEKGLERFVSLAEPASRLSVGDNKIVDVSLIDDSTLRLLALSPGRTTVSVWKEGSANPSTYFVTVTPALDLVRQRFSLDKSLSAGRLTTYGDKVVLDGQFEDAASQEQARKLASLVTGAEVLDLSDVMSDEVVQVEVQFAVIAKSTLEALGLNFSYLGQKFAVATTAPNTLQSFNFNQAGNKGLDIATAVPIANAFNVLLGSPDKNILSVISALKGSNLAKTLAEPTLVVRSGEKASFNVGGELPIPVPQGGTSNAITIEYKQFGVRLDVEPKILKRRRISLKIRPEVSEPDLTNAVVLQGFTIPALRTRSTQTTVDVGDNQTLVLAGLMLQTTGKINEKVPYLGDIPGLGKLFQRSQDAQEEQELIVVVTPRLVTAATQRQAAPGRFPDILDTGSLP